MCALEKEKIEITNVPTDYLRISSGLGEASPRSILVLPLIGEIDAERAGMVTERLLRAVVARRAHTVILDVTGVPSVDAEVVSAILRTASALMLLGAHPVLVGIRPEIARVMADLDVALAGLATLANLQSGIAYALRRQGLAVRPAARSRHAAARIDRGS